MPEPFSWLESACGALGADMSAFRQSEVFRYISGAMRASAAEALRLAESVYDICLLYTSEHQKCGGEERKHALAESS